jgi:ubiquinone/menaquinone biosynthesis C-methylase UbiE
MLSEENRIRDAYKRRESDKAGLYSLFNQEQLFWFQDLERALLGLLSENGVDSLEAKAILDIGCGSGRWIREFIKLGATPQNLAGIDLLDWRIDAARHTCPASVSLECGNAEKMGFSDRSFEVIVQFTVFSSILDPNMQRRVAAEMLRVLKDDGFIIWYDFFVRDPRNKDVKGLTKNDIRKLFPGCQIELRRVTLAPPLVRLIAPYSSLLCYVLERLKVFNTHYLGLIRKLPV